MNKPDELLTDNISLCFSIFIAVVILAGVYVRLFFGVNFSDEAYYLAIPFRFVTGSVPFRDDSTTLFTMFSFITYPLYKLFYLFNTSTDGLVLFSRYCYLTVAVCSGLVLFTFMRRLVSIPEAILIALLMIAFVPGNLHCLSYNTFALLLFPPGLLFAAFGVGENRPEFTLISGMIMAFVVIAYLPMLIPVCVGLLAILWYVKTDRLKYFGRYSLGILVVLVVMIPFLRHATLETLRDNWEYIQTTGAQGGGIRKIWHVFRGGFLGAFRAVTFGVAGVLLILRYMRSYPKILFILPFLPIFMAILNRYPNINPVASHGFALSMAFFLPFLIIRVPPDQRRLFFMIWIPSVAAGLTTGYSSNNGFVNLIIGLFPGVLASLVVMVLAIRNDGGESTLSLRTRCAFLACICLIFMYYQYATVYSDKSIGELSQQVTTGPYKYLNTTPFKAGFTEQITRDVREQSVKDGISSVLFYYDFPAGYLLTSLHPAANSVWLSFPKNSDMRVVSILEHRYRDPTNWPDMIVKLNGFMNYDATLSGNNTFPNHPFEKLLQQGEYSLLVSRDAYTIYRRSQ